MARRGGETQALRIAAPIIRSRARWLRALADVAAQQTRFLAACAPAVTSMAGAHGVQTRIPQHKNAGHRALIRQDRRVFGQARRAEKTSRYASLRCLIRSLRRRSFVSCRVMFFGAFSFVSLSANAQATLFIPHSADARAARALARGPEMASPAVSLFACRVREGRQVFFWCATLADRAPCSNSRSEIKGGCLSSAPRGGPLGAGCMLIPFFAMESFTWAKEKKIVIHDGGAFCLARGSRDSAKSACGFTHQSRFSRDIHAYQEHRR